MSLRYGPGRVVAVLAAALLAGLLVYVLVGAGSPNRITEETAASEALAESTPTATSQAPAPTASSSSTPVPTVAAKPATLPPVRPAAAPTEVAISSIDAELSVIPTGVTTDGLMEIPADPRVAGWYRYGPDPLSDSGAVVVSAHIDSKERVGPLARLGQVSPGDEVIVTTAGEEVRYVIERVDSYPKTVIDLDAVFTRDGAPRLHIVTCGGEWDASAGSYEDNIVAVAVRSDAVS
ncbi:sortase [Nostocoides sp. F2B08]|uniref:class F sortase n=1 Tax=Nostocoides sp. F2B08 TaxID=2653936 RepID=UPI001263453C|nr:class F sortase [Tetrasphaera sp. F2B08]KAB7743883.1 sortase [Tetrasphaera sp. F2B08]